MVNLIGTGGTGGTLSINDSASSVDLSASVQTAASNIDFGDNPQPWVQQSQLRPPVLAIYHSVVL